MGDHLDVPRKGYSSSSPLPHVTTVRLLFQGQISRTLPHERCNWRHRNIVIVLYYSSCLSTSPLTHMEPQWCFTSTSRYSLSPEGRFTAYLVVQVPQRYQVMHLVMRFFRLLIRPNLSNSPCFAMCSSLHSLFPSIPLALLSLFPDIRYHHLSPPNLAGTTAPLSTLPAFLPACLRLRGLVFTILAPCYESQ